MTPTSLHGMVASATGLKLTGVVASMVVSVLVARLLPIDEVAFYFLISSISFFGALVARFGMRQSIVKTIAASEAIGEFSTAKGAGKKFLVITLFGVLGISVLFLSFRSELKSSIFHSDAYPFVVYVTCWLAILALQSVLADIFRGYQHIALSTALDGVISAVVLAAALAGVLVFVGKANLTNVIYLTLFAFGVVSFVGFYKLTATWRLVRGGRDASSYRALLTLSWPIFIINMSVYLMGEASLWFVAIFDTSEHVATYGVCIKLVKLVTLPLLIQNIVVTPMIAKLAATEAHGRLSSMVRGAATITAVPSIVLIVLYLGGGESILGVLFGDHFSSGWVFLSVLSLGYLVNVLSGPCNNVLMVTGHERPAMKIFIASSVFGIVLMVLLGSRYGAIGVACSVSFALIVHNLVAVSYAYRLTGMKTYASFNFAYIKLLLRQIGTRGGGA